MRNIIFSADALANLHKFKSGNQNLIFKVLELLYEAQQKPFTGKR